MAQLQGFHDTFRCRKRLEQIKFFLRLYGLWEDIPPPPRPHFDIKTFEPIEQPWQATKEWIPADEPNLNWFNQPRKPKEPNPDWFDQSAQGALASRQRVSDDDPGTNWFDQRLPWQAPDFPLDDGRILVLEYT